MRVVTVGAGRRSGRVHQRHQRACHGAAIRPVTLDAPIVACDRRGRRRNRQRAAVRRVHGVTEPASACLGGGPAACVAQVRPVGKVVSPRQRRRLRRVARGTEVVRRGTEESRVRRAVRVVARNAVQTAFLGCAGWTARAGHSRQPGEEICCDTRGMSERLPGLRRGTPTRRMARGAMAGGITRRCSRSPRHGVNRVAGAARSRVVARLPPGVALCRGTHAQIVDAADKCLLFRVARDAERTAALADGEQRRCRHRMVHLVTRQTAETVRRRPRVRAGRRRIRDRLPRPRGQRMGQRAQVHERRRVGLLMTGQAEPIAGHVVQQV